LNVVVRVQIVLDCLILFLRGKIMMSIQ